MNLWVHLLLLTTHSEIPKLFNGKNIILKAGQLITGRKFLSKITKINESKIERILNYLESEQQIKQQKTNLNRLITIVKWKEYQDSEQLIEQQVNNDRTTSEQQVNTYNNDKNGNNGKNVKKQRGLEFSQIEFPETLNTEVIKESYKQWFYYLKEKRKKPTKTTIEMQLKFLSTSPANAVKIIERSIEKGWIGLFELPTNLNSNNGKSTNGTSGAEQTLRVTKI